MIIRMRHINDVSLDRVFTANLRGGERGFGDCMALETFSNEASPTLRCANAFVVVAHPVRRVYAVGRERTEEEKERRRRYGDKGARFSEGKRLCILGDVSGCVTTFPVKDNLVAEEKNINDMDSNNYLELEGRMFRIRKLTPREAFRLMGVDEADIDRIQAAGISNSGQYQLAGNSIVVDVLYHLLRKMLVEKEPDKVKGKPQQLTLF